MGANKINVVMITPDKAHAPFLADSLYLSTPDGHVSLLPGHVEYMCNIEISLLEIINDGHKTRYAVGGGVLHFTNAQNTAYLILNSVETAPEIDVQRAYKEKEEAEKILQANLSEHEQHRAELALKRAMNRLSLKDTPDE